MMARLGPRCTFSVWHLCLVVAVGVVVVLDAESARTRRFQSPPTVDADAAQTRGCYSPPRHSTMDMTFSVSGYSVVSLKPPSGTVGLGTSAAVARF